MANPANSTVQNLLPVQAYFNLDGSFNTFIGQGQPFYATANPQQSGLNITNSTINSTTIGATTPSTGVFTNIATTTGTITANASGATDIVNLLTLQSYAAGISWKNPVTAATTVNITLSGPQTIDTVAVVAGNTVLVKNQTNAAQNGIYQVNAGAWTYAVGSTTWEQYVSALVFVEYGAQSGSAWYCTAQPGGTLGVTAMNWSNFSAAANYTAGTGLTLNGFQFSITNTGVSAATYGSASSVPVAAINAQGQITSVTNTSIAINGNQITSGTIGSSYLSGAYTGITGLGTLGDLTVTNAIVGSITGNAATATTATKATNIAGGAAGSLPYQSAADTTTFLAAGTNGQVLTLASGVPSWATPTVGTVTSVSGAGTVNGLTLTGTVTTSGSLTLGGTLDLSSPPAIGGTTAAAITGTTITANTGFKGTYYDASGSGGGNLRTNSGVACFQWGAGGGTNCTVDGSINMNGANAQIDMSPSGTGHVHLNPAGSGSVEINPTAAGTMNNMVIGGTTPLAGTFTTLRVNSTISLAGSTGTSGYVLTSNGASAPTWQTLPASGLTVTDDTTTNATRYLTFTSATSGTITGINTASTELSWNPGLGIFNLSGATGALNIPKGTSAERPASPVTSMIRFNTSTSAYEVYSGATNGWVPLTQGSYNYTATYLVVAGGASGGDVAGGGAGGLLTSTATLILGTVYTVTVGAGGASTLYAQGINGSNSVISGTGLTTVTAIGGGGGGYGANGSSGGSGGGGGSSTGALSGGAGTSGQGFAGGNNNGGAGTYSTGGGGGASAVGGNGGTNSGNGGAGAASSITGSSVTYAGGGGGGGAVQGALPGSGGAGGGGAGGLGLFGPPFTGNPGSPGGTNTGGGGGGAYNQGYYTGAGGSGIVILSVPTANYSGTTTGSPTITTSGSNTIISFTASGTYTA